MHALRTAGGLPRWVAGAKGPGGRLPTERDRGRAAPRCARWRRAPPARARRPRPRPWAARATRRAHPPPVAPPLAPTTAARARAGPHCRCRAAAPRGAAPVAAAAAARRRTAARATLKALIMECDGAAQPRRGGLVYQTTSRGRLRGAAHVPAPAPLPAGAVLDAADARRRAFNAAFAHFGVSRGGEPLSWSPADYAAAAAGGDAAAPPAARRVFGRSGWPESALTGGRAPASEGEREALVEALEGYSAEAYQRLIRWGLEGC
jgi:hypothetical protein